MEETPSLGDPRIASLDIETFGSCHRAWDGTPLPLQRTFHPRRMVTTDGCPPPHLALTAALTLPLRDPRWLTPHPVGCSSSLSSFASSGLPPSASPASLTPSALALPQVSSPSTLPSTALTACTKSSVTSGLLASGSRTSSSWTGTLLADLLPGPTLIFNLWEPSHLACLRAWLLHLDTLVGMNIKFDLKVLRAYSPLLRSALPPRRHFLIDASILNYLHNETRPEKSLKDIGPLFLIYSYATTLKEGHRFPTPLDPKYRSYQAEDPHNTLLACTTLARHIPLSFPGTSKLSAFCLAFYSRVLWSCLLMEESGIPFSLTRLRRLHSFLTHRTTSLLSSTRESGLILQGKGSPASKLGLLTSLITEIEGNGTPLLNNPLLTFTPKKKTLSVSSANIDLVASHLPPSHPTLPLLRSWQTVEKHQKLLSTYTWPLLHHKRKVKKKGDPPDCSSVVLPLSATRGLAFPDWFPTPGPVKDGSGSDGGTLQGRITSKNPSSQTFPPIIKACIQSRWPGGTVLSIDLSQIELRVAALLSGEPSLLSAYSQKQDIHGRRAIAAWGERELLSRYPTLTGVPLDKWKSFSHHFDRRERQVGKRLNFADLFRAGAAKMQLSVYDDVGELFPLSFFQSIVDSRPFLRPRLYAWQSALIETAHSKGYLEIPFTGQSRYFMGGDKFDENEIVNCPVQTTAGNLMLELQAEISSHLPDPLLAHTSIHLFQNTYDALYLDIRHPSDVQWAKDLIASCFARLSSPGGYWHLLQSHTGNTCPIAYDLTLH